MTVQELQTLGGLVQQFLITGGVADGAGVVSLDQSGGLGIILSLADDLLHGITSFPSHGIQRVLYSILLKMQDEKWIKFN